MLERKSSASKISGPEYKSEDLKRFARFEEEVLRELKINTSDLGWEDMLLWHNVKKGITGEDEIEVRERNVLRDASNLTEAQQRFYEYLRSKAHKFERKLTA